MTLALTRHGPVQNGNGHVPLTPDLLTVLRTLERMHCQLRPREIASLGDLPAEVAHAAIMELLRRGHVEIRFVDLTRTGRDWLAEAAR